MIDDLDELRGLSFDLLLLRVQPPGRESANGRNPGLMFRLGRSAFDWRSGKSIPLRKTVERLLPELTATGVPADIWLEARELSVQIAKLSGYFTKGLALKCKSGRHDLTQIQDDRNRCPQCQAEREAKQHRICSFCGAEHNRRNKDFCSSCQNRHHRYGDPAPRNPPGESGYRGVYYAHQHTGGLRHWYARVYTPRKRYDLGMFLTAEEAARARDTKVIELGLHLRAHSPAKLNFPDLAQTP